MTGSTIVRAFVVGVALLIGASAGTVRDASGALPPGNTVEQWNQIAEDTVVGSGVFQIEGYLYMAYESTAVYDAVVAIEGRYQPLVPAFASEKRLARRRSRRGRLPNAQALLPGRERQLDPLYAAALRGDPRRAGQASRTANRRRAANQVIRGRSLDALTLPIGPRRPSPRSSPARASGGSRRPFAAAADPLGCERSPVHPRSATQFLPAPPPSLSSPEWVSAFNEVQAYGGANSTAGPSRRPTSPSSRRRT